MGKKCGSIPRKLGSPIHELFAPIPSESPQEAGIPAIAEALSGNIDKARESGHNAIFAAIAIRALHDHSQFATPTILEGIRRLIEGFDNATPGRGYYGKERGWIDG